MKEKSFSIKKDDAAQKIQAIYRGYSVRKHFLAVRLRFERIVKSIEGSAEVQWRFVSLCKPFFQDPQVLFRLKDLEQRQKFLKRELENTEKAIHDRKEFLKNR